jgi:exosome complex RNA-binding protein Rrp42 (RNase PH superfamily)
LNNDGNLIDAFNYAAIIALFRYKLPFVAIEANRLKVYSFEEKRPQSLSIHHFPISLTFCITTLTADDGTQSEYIVFDPTVASADSETRRRDIRRKNLHHDERLQRYLRNPLSRRLQHQSQDHQRVGLP